jgi:predicted transcriptional regulator YheO
VSAALVAHWRPMADGLAALFHPHVEVVIHDLSSQSIAYIANPLSKRAVGDDSALEDIAFEPGETVIGPYEKLNWDGARMRAVSVVARDAADTPVGMVCVNFSLAAFEGARAALDLLLANPMVAPQPEKLFRDDWQERINIFLQGWLAERGLVLMALSRGQKRELIEALHAEGAFRGRSAAPYVANVLGLSRATVFSHLKVLREG